jgi:hypothetical protein
MVTASPLHFRPSLLRELAHVRLAADLTVPEGLLPAGAEGVIVAVYADGGACEIEFTRPFHAVATVPTHLIRA